MSHKVWGDEQTQFFFELTPDRVLAAVESAGLLCTGRCMALNSFENRVYDVELEVESESETKKNPSLNKRIVKFYRPGRWTREQILEEHQFIRDLVDAEIPAIAPIEFPGGGTLQQTPVSGIYYALFPKVGGRAPDELTFEQTRWLGRLLARIHAVGASRTAPHRVQLTPDTYGIQNLEFLINGNWLPLEFKSRYEAVVREICLICDSWFKETPVQRVHGDCHLGNLLWNQAGPFFLDFDDMLRAPVIQDLWLLLPGRDEEARQRLNEMLEGYEEMRAFDRSQLRLIEPLRALRFVHYTAWVAKRWEDPAFPRAFPQFGSHQYWNNMLEDLEEQRRLIRSH